MEVAIKSHLIVTDIHSEYDISWCGRMQDTDPIFVNNAPVFIVRSGGHRIELNTWDMKKLEEMAKRFTAPKGRGAISKDKAHIYLKETNGKETLMGVITHRKVKTFAPMYDIVEWR